MSSFCDHSLVSSSSENFYQNATAVAGCQDGHAQRAAENLGLKLFKHIARKIDPLISLQRIRQPSSQNALLVHNPAVTRFFQGLFVLARLAAGQHVRQVKAGIECTSP